MSVCVFLEARGSCGRVCVEFADPPSEAGRSLFLLCCRAEPSPLVLPETSAPETPQTEPPQKKPNASITAPSPPLVGNGGQAPASEGARERPPLGLPPKSCGGAAAPPSPEKKKTPGTSVSARKTPPKTPQSHLNPEKGGNERPPPPHMLKTAASPFLVWGVFASGSGPQKFWGCLSPWASGSIQSTRVVGGSPSHVTGRFFFGFGRFGFKGWGCPLRGGRRPRAPLGACFGRRGRSVESEKGGILHCPRGGGGLPPFDPHLPPRGIRKDKTKKGPLPSHLPPRGI
jgi:hypothetical protein